MSARQWEKVLLILADLGGEASLVQVREVIIRDRDALGLSPDAAAHGLRRASRTSPPLAEVVRQVNGYTTVYRLTEAGRAWAGEEGRPS